MKVEVVRGSRVVLPSGVGPAAIHIRDGRISRVTTYDDVPVGLPASSILDAGSLYVLPGLVDTHVHINDPGRTTWEGFESATKAAAAGGVTTLVDMPLNSIPATVTPEAVEAKLRVMDGRAFVDVGLCGGLVPSNASNIRDLHAEGVIAFKCFLAESGVDEFAHVGAEPLLLGLQGLAKVDAPLFVHAELPGPLEEAARALGNVSASDARRYATYLASRPKSAEEAAIELVLASLRRSGARAHIVHLSAATALPILERARDEGIPLSAETCPHYLTLAAEDVPDGATAFKCAPPIRERENQDKLWQGLRDGLIRQVVTDHSPSTMDLKCSGSGDFMRAWGGISSLQLGFAVVYDAARRRGVPIAEVVRWMSAEPARLAGLEGRKGAIAVGCDADFAIYDESEVWSVRAEALLHKNPVCAYEGRELHGRVVRTVLRGEVIYDRSSPAPHSVRASGSWLRRR